MRSNPPLSVVFVHGWSCDRSYWKEQLDYFAEVHRTVALDLSGHGDSGLNRDDWTIPAFGEDIAAVISGLKLERVVLVGHSMGGPVIVEAARIAPQEVTGLVVVDALQDPDAPGMTLEAMQGFLERFEEDFSDAMRDLVSTGMFVPESDPILKAWIVKDMASGPPQVGVGALRANILWPSTTRSDALAALRVPVRLINFMMEKPKTFNALLSSAMADFAK